MDGSIFQSKSNQTIDDLTVVIPAHNELPETVRGLYDVLSARGIEVIVVDDGATMDLNIPHISHRPRMGYGYSLKKGIRAATRPYVLTMDGDGQHRVADVLNLYYTYINLVNTGIDIKMMVGVRYNLKEKFKRMIGRKVLNFIATIVAGHYFVDLNSGLRIFERQLSIAYEQILCDEFSFTTSLTMSMVTDGMLVGWLPINVQPRDNGKSRVRVIRHGITTLYYILRIGLALRTRHLRAIIRPLKNKLCFGQ